MTRLLTTYLVALWLTVIPASAIEIRPATETSIEQIRQRLKIGEPTRIVCFGDSITGAYYHSGGQRAWCDLLGLALQRTYPRANIEMINAGASGHTTDNAWCWQ